MIEKGKSKSQQLYRVAKTLIPGGTQLLSKRPEMFAPDQWPAYVQFHQGVYQRIKQAYPYLPLGVSVPLKYPGSVQAETIRKMARYRMPYNVNTFGVAAAMAS